MINYHVDYSERPSLFDDNSIECFSRTPIRPLGTLSHYVAEKLPKDIDTLWNSPINSGDIIVFAKKIGKLVDPISDAHVLSLDEGDMAVARTDIIYPYNALIQTGITCGVEDKRLHDFMPRKLLQLVHLSACITSTVPTLTYEDLILFNPLTTDPRVFCTGAAGHAEKDFCNGHRYIEWLLGKAIESLARGLASKDMPVIMSALKDATAHFQETAEVMKTFGDDMQPDLFGVFRERFGKNPFYKTLGPSGRFSAKIPHVTALLVGDELGKTSPDFFHSLFENRGLYPAKDFYFMARAICSEFHPDIDVDRDSNFARRRVVLNPETGNRERPTMYKLISELGKPPPLVHAFNRCVEALDIFTAYHITGARKHTVDPRKTVVGATESESVEHILRRRSNLHKLLKLDCA